MACSFLSRLRNLTFSYFVLFIHDDSCGSLICLYDIDVIVLLKFLKGLAFILGKLFDLF